MFNEFMVNERQIYIEKEEKDKGNWYSIPNNRPLDKKGGIKLLNIAFKQGHENWQKGKKCCKIII
ncbi:hypothetical protein J7L87_00515 [bacterium]|nr:hypothetical protein [bacterium]